MLRLPGIVVLAAALTGSAFGGTIVSDFYCCGSTGSGNGTTAVDWTQTGTYTNVTIGANLATQNGLSTSTGIAYLLTQIGPGTTSADEVTAPFSISVSGNPGINTLTTLFTGLTLGPGTYYLVVVPTDVNMVDSLDWDETTLPMQVLDSGVTQGVDDALPGSFNTTPTADTFSHIFSVTGTLGQTSSPGVPEPATVATTLAGLAALGVMRRKAAAKD